MKRFLFCLLALILIYLGTTVIGPRTPISVEPFVVEDIRAITKAQLLYSLTKGRGQFTDLTTLAGAGLIDPALASGEKNGYLFATQAVEGRSMMFDVIARPAGGEAVQTRAHSYYSNERAVQDVYKIEGGEPAEVTQEDRVPKRGILVREE